MILPVIMLPRPGPLWGWFSIYQETCTFSLPLSDHTRDGKPYLLTASKNNIKTVSLILLLEADT